MWDWCLRRVPLFRDTGAGGYRAGMAGWLLQGVGSGSLGGWFSDLWDAGYIAGELELLALRTMGLVHPASSSHRLAPP